MRKNAASLHADWRFCNDKESFWFCKKKAKKNYEKLLTNGPKSCIILFVANGWVPEWLKGADCKSAAFRFVGSNPTPSTNFHRGVEQLVARRAHNPKVGGSSPPPATN